jgi:nitrogen fixation NifU-like protein
MSECYDCEKPCDVRGWFYTDTVKDHFFNPRNICKTQEELEEFKKKANARGVVGSPACGDVMEMFLVIESNIIKDCRWRTFGCASALASTSILSEMVKGKTIQEAEKITPKDILNKLGGLPPKKVHCSVLGDQALRAAIKNYKESN